MVGPSASKRSLSHVSMSIFDTGSNTKGFSKTFGKGEGQKEEEVDSISKQGEII